MEYSDREFCIEVSGAYALFTRPELKVERFSYDVITPSASRAIFEAIFRKPAIRWEVTKIEVLNPIKWDSIKRNEIGATMSPRSNQIFIEERRQQRAAVVLRDVAYRITAKMIYIPPHLRKNEAQPQRDGGENPMKYYQMFERRAAKGQCFTQPYLGCREFSAYVRYIDNYNEEVAKRPTIPESRDLGIMLYDMDFDTTVENPPALFYRAKMEQGCIVVPSKDSKEILR